MKIERVLVVPVVPRAGCIEDNCHNNVSRYVANYGGVPVRCMYLDSVNDRINLIEHSILKTADGRLYDITPMYDNRRYNTIIICDTIPFRAISILQDSSVEFF